MKPSSSFKLPKPVKRVMALAFDNKVKSDVYKNIMIGAELKMIEAKNTRRFNKKEVESETAFEE